MNRKRLPILLSCLVALSLACLCFVACDKTPADPNKPIIGGDEGDPEQYVVSMTYSGEYKSHYYEGESFDPSGLTVTATWYDDDVETLTARDYEISPEVLAPTDTHVRLTYEDNYVDIPVTVSEIVPTEIEVSGMPDMTQYYGYDISFADITVFAVTASGDKVKLGESSYTVTLDGELVTEDVKPDCDIHTVSIVFKDKSKDFDLVVIDGTRIEAENYIRTTDIKDTDKNFVEKLDGQTYTDQKADSASGGMYLGDTSNAKILFHVWADSAGKATLILRAASGSAVPSAHPDVSDGWGSPVQMNAMVFAESATVRIKTGTADAYETLDIDGDIVLPGGVALTDDGIYDPKGDPELWTNWFDVPFGEYEFTIGDNIVELTVNSAMNIDRFEVRYLPEEHVHDGRGMAHTPEVKPTCYTVGVREYFTCGLCGKRYADKLGTNELSRLILDKTHKLGDLVVPHDVKTEYYAGQKFDATGCGSTCSECDEFVTADIDTGAKGGFIETDTKKVTVSNGAQSKDISVTVKGIAVNADRYKNTSDGTGNYDGDKSYTENRDGCNYAMYDCQYPASSLGHKYFGGITAGDTFYFHIVSDVAITAKLELTIASANVHESVDDKPASMWGVEFSADTFKVWKSSKTDGNRIDSVKYGWYGGCEAADKTEGDNGLYERWTSVEIGNVEFAVGDNLIIVQVPGVINVNELVCTFAEV